MELGLDFQIIESFDLRESKIENDIIRNISILNQISKNNRKYTDNALTNAASVFEGAKSYINHNLDIKTRKVEDLIGGIKNVHRELNTIKGDLQLLDSPHKKLILSIAERAPYLAGFSIDAQGRTYKDKDGVEIVESISKINSIDLVAEPATTLSIYESIQENQNGDLNQDVVFLTEQKTKLVKELKKIELSIDDAKNELELYRNTIKREKLIESVLKDFPEELISDLLLEQLKNAKDLEDMERIISDRRSLNSRPVSKEKTEGFSPSKLDDTINKCFGL